MHSLSQKTATVTCADRPAKWSWAFVGQLFSVYRERHSLRHLDDHILKDIGLDRIDALEEADKPLWDMPENRRF